ncbi:DUF4328 domain-containing protein [Streptomyces sp. ISL-98]|uniref:DUF4328 domain-containing protein n=1 Tax=Streptomyces sp. ISL-98 TaxID=2819192 RepID=UPI001BE817C8|nr:DUF4328 domain-containing protein [Streptomyces sp. ISL-98]MBT2507241.1 DUF4328 domain-containing protein [Streptomyces sp. ISL-98]
MPCSNCGTEKATTGEGLCDGCVIAAAHSAPLPRAPAVPLSGPAAVLRSPVGLSYAVMALLGAVVAADCFSFVVLAHSRGQWSDLASEGFSTVAAEEIDRSQILVVWSSMVYAPVLVATAAVFLVWFFRVRRNADVFAPDLQRRGRGWAIGTWFIPVANLWMPRGIAVDVWAASRRDPYGLETAKREPKLVLDLWWTAWVASLLYGRFANKRYEKAEAPADIRDALDLLIVADLLDIAAAVLAIFFVRALTRMQHLKATAGPAVSTEPPLPGPAGAVIVSERPVT